jgi:hypothetical protein
MTSLGSPLCSFLKIATSCSKLVARAADFGIFRNSRLVPRSRTTLEKALEPRYSIAAKSVLIGFTCFREDISAGSNSWGVLSASRSIPLVSVDPNPLICAPLYQGAAHSPLNSCPAKPLPFQPLHHLDNFNRQMRETHSESTSILPAPQNQKHTVAAFLDDQLSVIVLSRAPC